MTFEWKLYVRNGQLQRVGELDEYTDATLKPIYSDVGTWSVTMDGRCDMATTLTTPGYGIIATRNGVTLLSGPATYFERTVDIDTNQLIVSGVTDEIWLKRRVVSPSPSESVPPYVVQAYDVRTGKASTVLAGYVNANLGPGAITPRRLSGLTIATDPLIGTTVTGSGRWDNLLTFLQTLAVSGGVGFRLVQVGTGLQFQALQGVNRAASIAFSRALGNVSSYKYTRQAPDSTYAYVGATGTGTARVIYEAPDSEALAEWGRIEGDLITASVNDPVQLAQTATAALAQHSEQITLAVTPVETPTLMYGVHYSLGDTVTIQLDGTSVDDRIIDQLQSVEIHLSKDGPQTVTPAFGTPSRQDIAKLFRAFQNLRARLIKLEGY